MKKKKVIKGVIIGGLVALLLAIGGMTIWSSNTYEPSEVLAEVVSIEDYKVVDDFLVFEPQGEPNGAGIILYPGALVEPLAYGYYAKGLAEAGYLVAIPNMPLNLALLGSEKASEIISLYPNVKEWIIGGHSMGGVAAAMYAKEHPEVIKGLVLLASYPAEISDLSTSEVSVLSLYGTYDGLTTLEDIEKSKLLLPSDTVFVEIKGANHAQFGIYGSQKGDLEATIDVLDQQRQMIDATISFFENEQMLDK